MKKIAFAVATAAAVSIALTAVPAFAHHPFDAEFDWKKPVTLMGTVTKIGWSNPHAEVSIDARDASGATTHWVLELGNPRVLEKNYQWKADLLKAGDKITVHGWLAKDGRKFVSSKSITLSDGRELFAASSFFDTPGKCISDEVCVNDASTVGQNQASGTQR
jgi:hypothetical protein